MKQKSQYTISQLANAADVPTTTVRYYERVGLLAPDDRSQGNYRLYSDDSLSCLRFIRAAQTIGFTLDDIKTLVRVRSGGAVSCGDVQTLLDARLTGVEQQLKSLQRVKRVLKSAIEKCHHADPTGSCHVIERLEQRA